MLQPVSTEMLELDIREVYQPGSGERGYLVFAISQGELAGWEEMGGS